MITQAIIFHRRGREGQGRGGGDQGRGRRGQGRGMGGTKKGMLKRERAIVYIGGTATKEVGLGVRGEG